MIELSSSAKTWIWPNDAFSSKRVKHLILQSKPCRALMIGLATACAGRNGGLRANISVPYGKWYCPLFKTSDSWPLRFHLLLGRISGVQSRVVTFQTSSLLPRKLLNWPLPVYQLINLRRGLCFKLQTSQCALNLRLTLSHPMTPHGVIMVHKPILELIWGV